MPGSDQISTYLPETVRSVFPNLALQDLCAAWMLVDEAYVLHENATDLVSSCRCKREGARSGGATSNVVHPVINDEVHARLRAGVRRDVGRSKCLAHLGSALMYTWVTGEVFRAASKRNTELDERRVLLCTHGMNILTTICIYNREVGRREWYLGRGT